MRSKIVANLNVLEFVKISGEICLTLGVRWSNRYGVTAPLGVHALARTKRDRNMRQRSINVGLAFT